MKAEKMILWFAGISMIAVYLIFVALLIVASFHAVFAGHEFKGVFLALFTLLLAMFFAAFSRGCINGIKAGLEQARSKAHEGPTQS